MDGFAGYYGVTNIHTYSLVILLFSGAAILFLSRRYALFPLVLVAATIPMSQRLVVAGADLTLLRILLLVYLVRILMRREWSGSPWSKVDTAMLLWVALSITTMTLYFGTTDALINRLGASLDILGTYLVARVFIQSWTDIVNVGKWLALIAITVSVAFVVERYALYNPFSIFGGVSESPRITEGRVRARGPAPHPIIAGAFWAAAIPMILMLWSRDNLRSLFFLGLLAAAFIVIATGSSTSLAALAVIVALVAFFPFRIHRTKLWVSFLLLLLALHIVMNNPVWHLMARVDILGGSTGWHRYLIFDRFVNNFGDWYLLGYSTPTDWAWQMRDITNQFVLIGLRGGILTLLAFCWVLVRLFQAIGETLSRIRLREEKDVEWYAWLLGVALFTHVVTFFGVSYFGQVGTLLYLQFGAVASLALAEVGRESSPNTVNEKPKRFQPT